MAETDTPGQDIRDHQATYNGFVRGSIAVCLYCVYVLAALSNFSYGQSSAVLISFIGLMVGLIVIVFDVQNGSKTWVLSLGVFVIFALVCAFNVT